MNGLHLFIDNSNIFIEAQRTAREQYFYDDELIIRLRVSYGELLDFVRGQRELKETVLVGSRPPANDVLWNRLKDLKIEPKIFDRSMYSGKEKNVGVEFINAIRDTLDDNPKQETIAVVVGDSDYLSTLERCVKKSWEVEIYFWEQASKELKNLQAARFISLNTAFKKITFLEKARG